MADYVSCVNCGHPVYRYGKRYLWWHFRKKEGTKRGTSRLRCFQCECVDPKGGF